MPRRLPSDFAELLSPAGERVLDGKWPHALHADRRFTAATGLLDPRQSRRVLEALERALPDVLTPMEDPIPEWTITGMHDNYGELLPKTVRVRTALMASRRSKAWLRAEEIGLHALLKSKTFHQFAQGLSVRRLRTGWGTQVLCYQPGDYSGPHNDHHPEEPDARNGYVDLHLTFCTSGVADQRLVYAKDGHFSESANVATVGGVTCYRLPFWHFTTPLLAKRRGVARRWVLLGTFLDATTSP